MTDGNFQEALNAFSQRLSSSATDPKELPQDLRNAVNCLRQLNRIKEFDRLVESAVERHSGKWRLLSEAARQYMSVPHYGYQIAGDFERGQHRGGGKVMHATERDHVRSLQLLVRALELVEADSSASREDAADVAQQLAHSLLHGRGGHAGWRLQILTDLSTLPDYEEGWGPRGDHFGAPVDDDNNPVFHELPGSWDDAKNDGERWRWALSKMTEHDSSRRYVELTTRADFLRSQFGVTTLGGDLRPLVSRTDMENSVETSVYTLDTLEENETLARLATGVQRFELPDEHNFIKLYKQALRIGQQSDSRQQAGTAAEHLARLFADRRQYPRAAKYWKTVLEQPASDGQKQTALQQIEQIEKPRGQFETGQLQPAGKGATFDYRFRNGKQVEFTAHAIDVPKLLADLKAYLKSKPKELEWTKVDLDQLGYRLVHENQEQYVGEEVAQWQVGLDPRPNHLDRLITVTSPLQEAGAYLVTAKLEGGNTAKIVLWVADTAIVKKPLGDATLYYVADAVTGRPIEKANLELFGYRYERPSPNELNIDIEQFAELTDANGQVVVPTDDGEQQQRHQWISIATTEGGRLAFLGFHHVWRTHDSRERPERVSTFAITDRPVYRPGDQVRLKLWVERARYDGPDESDFAHKTFQLEIHDPKGEKVFTKKLTANAYGGVAGEFGLPPGATLGQYRYTLVNYGGGTFRVEEYKKPEFEVTVDAPSERIKLGERFEASVSARYYFGEPVREGTVQYKVTRTTRNEHWFPPGPWDWLYGKGYWWFGYDYDWYPGWERWGCQSPSPWWIWRQPEPPEVVAQGEAALGAEGTIKIPIDTTLAKELHPDEDHEYQIEAEVVDRSRRTIVGSGKVLVARKPFDVCAWTDRGFYRTGDTITASFHALAPTGDPIAGKGKLKLLSVSYPENDPREPVETEVRSWDLDTNEEGRAELQIKASEAGQYRLSYELTSAGGETMEGGYFFTIVGPDFNGDQFRFSDLELVPDKQHYEPGDKLQLQVNVNQLGGAVLLYVRPENGVYDPPRLLRLKGKSTIVELEVDEGDMPNFYVEAQTVSGGRVHTVARQIAVPPTKRVINVEVAPSSAAYKPGQEATVKVRLTDDNDQPVVGDTVLSVYDESLEYISGGSNVGDIRETFWGWKRDHRPSTEHNLDRYTPNLVPPGEEPLQPIGAFGNFVEVDAINAQGELGRRQRGQLNSFDRSRGLGAGGAMPEPAAMPMETSAAVAEEGVAAATKSRTEASAEATPTVRKEFADTAHWSASVETSSDGLAEISFPMPENLSKWKFMVWSMGRGVRVGDGSATAVTRKNLLVRLQTPRFLVERDEVVISANVHNYLPNAKQVRVRLELDGDYLAATGDLESQVEIEPDGEARVDWRLKANRKGTATLRAYALSDEEADAMQLEVPVKVHGIEKLVPHSGAIASDQSRAAFEVTVPTERRVSETELAVQFSPTLAGAMVDALPYLIEYPYGCTEQTLNRFLPAVITQQTLKKMGVDLAQVRDKQTNLNPQELGEPGERAEDWKRLKSNAVFDEDELQKVVKAGVNRLSEMQLADGGWGWFSGFGEWSSPHTTAVVVRGLIVARENDVAIVPGVLEQGIEWLAKYQSSELEKLENCDEQGKPIDKDKLHKVHADNTDALVYMVLTEARSADFRSAEPSQMQSMRAHLYADRTQLAVYSLATLGLALHYEVQLDDDDAVRNMRDMVINNVSQYVITDAENQTAYLNLPGEYWWYWYGSEFEAHAYYLKLLAATDPDSDVASAMVKYLLNNRKHATYWNSTRDTALVIEAMADYLEATGEGSHEMTVEVWMNGQRQKTVEITPAVLFTFDNRFVIQGDDIEGGRHTLELRKQGEGRLYYNAYLSFFSLEDDIDAAGVELKIARKYYKLTPVDAETHVAGGRGQAVLQKVEKFERTEIPNLGVAESGDLVEIELTVESKNDYEYIVLEDLKAAGFEPVEVQSGYNGNELNAYMELRDDRVSLFVRRLARGTHNVSYRMRAETPGTFAALPTRAYAMYAPELKGNSSELKVRVVDED